MLGDATSIPVELYQPLAGFQVQSLTHELMGYRVPVVGIFHVVVRRNLDLLILCIFIGIGWQGLQHGAIQQMNRSARL